VLNSCLPSAAANYFSLSFSLGPFTYAATLSNLQMLCPALMNHRVIDPKRVDDAPGGLAEKHGISSDAWLLQHNFVLITDEESRAMKGEEEQKQLHTKRASSTSLTAC
jgi:hypothetical protein